MNIEIERKFLVKQELLPGCLTGVGIAQGYLSTDPKRTVRIRVGNGSGYITVKGESSEDGLSRYEWEKEIPKQDALEMMKLCTRSLTKTRYEMIHKGKVWEIDVFHGDNQGLVIAEIELESVDDPVELPDWVGQEVTGDQKYYNSMLTLRPFSQWDNLVLDLAIPEDNSLWLDVITPPEHAEYVFNPNATVNENPFFYRVLGNNLLVWDIVQHIWRDSKNRAAWVKYLHKLHN